MTFRSTFLAILLLIGATAVCAEQTDGSLLQDLDSEAEEIGRIIQIIEGEDQDMALALLNRIETSGNQLLKTRALDAALNGPLRAGREKALWEILSRRKELIVELHDAPQTVDQILNAPPFDTLRFHIYDLDPTRQIGELYRNEIAAVAERDDTFSVSGDTVSFIVTGTNWTGSARLTLSEAGHFLIGPVEIDGAMLTGVVAIR